ncbi:hypothetical protein [Pseudomonas sp. 28 E 9]|nr:hypothetical protein [Pseudomonas sp. 28 E 9]
MSKSMQANQIVHLQHNVRQHLPASKNSMSITRSTVLNSAPTLVTNTYSPHDM